MLPIWIWISNSHYSGEIQSTPLIDQPASTSSISPLNLCLSLSHQHHQPLRQLVLLYSTHKRWGGRHSCTLSTSEIVHACAQMTRYPWLSLSLSINVHCFVEFKSHALCSPSTVSVPTDEPWLRLSLPSLSLMLRAVHSHCMSSRHDHHSPLHQWDACLKSLT